jgi:Protein of unknown function (DUF1194)
MGFFPTAVCLPEKMRILSGLVALSLLPGFARADCADLALVLAVDASGSIGAEEFALQQAGYVAAFRSGRVQRALAAAGQVDVAVVLWGDTEMAPQILGWQRVAGPADAELLAARIAGMVRRVTGDTGIGAALWTALDELDLPGQCAARALVNISGDGVESAGARPRRVVPLVTARARAGAMGVTVNALAITTDNPDLAGWYRDRVIIGPGAFVMQVAGFETFGEAIIEKLAREIRPQAVAALER